MNNELAIRIITGDVLGTSEQTHEAIKMAVSALSHPDVADINVGDTLPPAEPQWIPVTEKMPDDLVEVNVTWVNHNPTPNYALFKDKPLTSTAVYFNDKWYWSSCDCIERLKMYGHNYIDEIDEGIEIIAWMPLPEPYTGGKADGRAETVSVLRKGSQDA